MKHWSKRSQLPAKRLLGWLGLGTSKFHDWRKRYGKVNEHNAMVPRDEWLEDGEKKAILDFQDRHPLEGYRRLCFMMLDGNIVAVSPSSVYRVLKQAGRLDRRWLKPSKKGTGFVQPLVDAAEATRDAHPDVRIDQFGDGSANQWFNDTIGRDFQRAEWTAVPLALGILLIAFGALVAAVLPVVLALTAFIAAGGLVALSSGILHTSDDASSVMLLVGLAVGVDYCLFYLRREREERAAGRDAATALQVAAATSGRAVLVSGVTVVVAMAGLFLTGIADFRAMSFATIIVGTVMFTIVSHFPE